MYFKIAIIFAITAGVAVLLTIITYFSTPIMTKIFGDGSLEVTSHTHEKMYKQVQVFFLTPSLNIRGRKKRTGLSMRSQLMRR